MPEQCYCFSGKRVLVVGMARSGVDASRLLMSLDAVPLLNDLKKEEAFGDSLSCLKGTAAEWHLGEDPIALLSQADAVVISPGVPIDAPVVLEARKRGMYLIGEMELAAQCAPGTMIGITGTNGKTTTVTLLGEILKAAGHKTFVSGNIGLPLSQTAMESRKEDMLVTEISSFQLESVDRFHAHVAAVLNVTEDHLIRHYTMENYIALKRRVFQRQTKEDFAVLNADDPICVSMAEGLSGNVAWFSRKRQDLPGACVKDGVITVCWDGKETPVCPANEVYIPGPHNLENALAAVLMAYFLNVPAAVIADTLRTFKGVEHRIEFVREVGHVRYINDSKGTNADSTVKAIDTMTAPTVLILGGYDKHVSFKGLAEHMKKSPQIIRAVLMGATADQLERELREAGFDSLSRARDLRDAVNISRSFAPEGGCVLLSPACASFDMFSCFEERGEKFKEIVRQMESV